MKPCLLNKEKSWSIPGFADFAAIGVLFVLLILSVWPANVQADCSQAYGRAFINEFNTKSRFVEVYFNPGVPEGDYRVEVCDKDGCEGQIFHFDGSSLWVYHELSTIDNNDNFDITLYDFDGDVVDYINVHISQGHGQDADERSFYNIDYEDCDSILNSISNDDNSPHLIERNNSGQRQFYRTTDGEGSWQETNKNNNNTYGESNHGAEPLSLHHVRIEHDGAGLTCMAEAVTIRACADADCIVAYTGEVTVDLISPDSGWSPDPVTFSGGSTTIELRHATAETVTLDINGLTSTETNAKTCINTTTYTASCDITFYEAGFIFDVPPQTACQTSANVTISAVRTDLTTQQCVPGFSNRSEDVSFWSTYRAPLTGTEAVQINSTTIATATPGTAISLTFDANGESTFDVTYDDAGNMQLNARFNGTGTETDLVMLGSDTFVVKPDHFLLAATKNDGTTALNNTTSGGSPIEAAGTDFRITAQAVCADNSTVTQNYIPTNAQIWIERTGPTAFGNEGTLTFPDLTTPTNHTTSLSASPVWNNVSTSFVNGMLTDPNVTYATANYSEVGLITLHLRDSDYLGETIAENTIDIGRFTPHHFSVGVSPAPPLFTDACIAGNYSYLGEPFPFATPPTITITAFNGAPTPAITRNYDCGGFWKFAAPMDLVYSYTDSSGNDLGLTPAAGTVNPLAGDSSDCNGTAQLTLTDTITYQRPAMASPLAPFTASVDLAINATQLTDNDSVCYDTGSGCQGFSQSAITGTTLRHGSIQVFNNFGPETMDITHSPFTAHYYDGTSWVTNTEDECSTALAFCSSPIAGRVTPLSIQPDPLSGGLGTFTATTAGTFGETIDICLIAPAWLSETDCTAPDLSCGTFTFGIYRGNDRIINWREIIQ